VIIYVDFEYMMLEDVSSSLSRSNTIWTFISIAVVI